MGKLKIPFNYKENEQAKPVSYNAMSIVPMGLPTFIERAKQLNWFGKNEEKIKELYAAAKVAYEVKFPINITTTETEATTEQSDSNPESETPETEVTDTGTGDEEAPTSEGRRKRKQ